MTGVQNNREKQMEKTDKDEFKDKGEQGTLKVGGWYLGTERPESRHGRQSHCHHQGTGVWEGGKNPRNSNTWSTGVDTRNYNNNKKGPYERTKGTNNTYSSYTYTSKSGNVVINNLNLHLNNRNGFNHKQNNKYM